MVNTSRIFVANIFCSHLNRRRGSNKDAKFVLYSSLKILLGKEILMIGLQLMVVNVLLPIKKLVELNMVNVKIVVSEFVSN